MKMNWVASLFAAFLIALPVTASLAQSDLVIYPAKGQSDAKMAKDKSECEAWAMKESGANPAAQTQQPAEASTAPKGERVRGGARGAAGGAAIGAIAGDAGKGAEIGAVAGGMRGGMEQRRERREAKAEQAQMQAKAQQDKTQFNRAYSACLEGRGYTVK